MVDPSLNWSEVKRVDSKWIDRFLLTHTKNPVEKNKIVARAYSIRFASTTEHMAGLVKYMRDAIIPYVFSDQEIQQFKTNNTEPWPEARNYFGATDPTSDGKCGEFLLYLLVEAVLGTPMVAHKIKMVGDNPKDQMKGSDGVFFGNYRGHNSLLLGEAKMYQDDNDAINKALESINKFYDWSKGGQQIENELFVIALTRIKNLSVSQLELLEKILNVKSEEYMKTNKVHPILIVYDEQKITDIEKICSDSVDGDKKACETLQGLAEEKISIVQEKLEAAWNSLEPMYLDFFFMPVTSVDKFRNLFFQQLHGMIYPKPNNPEPKIPQAQANQKVG